MNYEVVTKMFGNEIILGESRQIRKHMSTCMIGILIGAGSLNIGRYKIHNNIKTHST